VHRLADDPLGLVAVLGGELPVASEYSIGRQNYLAIAGGMRGDLRRVRARVTAAGDCLAYPLMARAGGVEKFLGVALDLRAAAS
jgi:hypothetical protein